MYPGGQNLPWLRTTEVAPSCKNRLVYFSTVRNICFASTQVFRVLISIKPSLVMKRICLQCQWQSREKQHDKQNYISKLHAVLWKRQHWRTLKRSHLYSAKIKLQLDVCGDSNLWMFSLYCITSDNLLSRVQSWNHPKIDNLVIYRTI